MAGRGVGKEQPNSELVMTPGGFVPMGLIKRGDDVIGSDGSAIEVLEVHPQGKKQVYEVLFDDGRKVKCGLEHLWTVTDKKDKKVKTLPLHKLKDYITGDNGTARFSVALGEGIKYKSKALKVSAYNTAMTLCKSGGAIPSQYNMLSKGQRTNFIKGMLKVNGYCPDGIQEFHHECPILTADFLNLIRSVGIKATVKQAEDKTFIIRLYTTEPLLGSEKLRRRIRTDLSDKGKEYYNSVSIVGVKDLGYKEESTCLSVDAEDNLYVTKDFILTHNTYAILSILAKIYHLKPSSHCMVSASQPKHAEEAFSKLLQGVDSISEVHPTLALNRIRDTKHYIESGQEVMRDGVKFVEGPRSKLQRVVYGEIIAIVKLS